MFRARTGGKFRIVADRMMKACFVDIDLPGGSVLWTVMS